LCYGVDILLKTAHDFLLVTSWALRGDFRSENNRALLGCIENYLKEQVRLSEKNIMHHRWKVRCGRVESGVGGVEGGTRA